MWNFIGILSGIGIVIYGIVLLTGSLKFLSGSRLMNAGSRRGSGALKVYRLTGFQLVLMGSLLVATVAGFMASNAALALGAGITLILMPVPFSIYMKKSKKFNNR